MNMGLTLALITMSNVLMRRDVLVSTGADKQDIISDGRDQALQLELYPE